MQTIGMYVMHLPLYVAMILGFLPGVQEGAVNGLLIATLVLMALMVPICVINVVFSLKSALKDEVDPTKATMISKLALIPWYVLNFLICLVFVGIFFNPFMMVGIPILIALTVGVTYALMLCTSVGDIAYYVKKILRKDEDVNTRTIVAVVFLFIFCLDIVGAIILYRQSQKSKEEQSAIDPAE